MREGEESERRGGEERIAEEESEYYSLSRSHCDLHHLKA